MTLSIVRLLASAILICAVESPRAFRDVRLPKALDDPSPYLYRATVENVVDGDTVDVKLSVAVPINKVAGYGVDIGVVYLTLAHRVRLYGINAWEVHETGVAGEKAKGLVAKKWLTDFLKGKRVYMFSIKDARDKYGRPLGVLLVANDDGSFAVVNQMLVEQGHAVLADY